MFSSQLLHSLMQFSVVRDNLIFYTEVELILLKKHESRSHGRGRYWGGFCTTARKTDSAIIDVEFEN